MEWKIVFDMEWLFEDKRREGVESIVEADDELNAVAALQFLTGDKIQLEIISVTRHR